MSESPKTEKGEYLSRFSTPVPELDDHRFQVDPEDPNDTVPDIRKSFSQPYQPEMVPPLDQDRLHVHDAHHEPPSPGFRDLELGLAEEDHRSPKSPKQDMDAATGRFSIEPAGSRRGSRMNRAAKSRESSVSAASTSPPNSVEAFADPRRRERANTLESLVPPEVDVHAAMSGGTATRRRPTFSNASAARPDIRLESVDDVVGAGAQSVVDEPGRVPVIDYEELEEFVALNNKAKSARKHSMSTQSKKGRVFHDLRPSFSNFRFPTYDHVDSPSALEEKDARAGMEEKELLDTLQNENEPTRFSFFSSESQSTVHASDLGDLVLPGDTFRDLFELGPAGGVWWLDVVSPTEAELQAISKAFSIHPLTTEDIVTQEAREKVELFKQYYFICFRTFYQLDKTSERFMEPVNLYMVVFRDGVLTFSFTENPHASNVRQRIGKLREYVSLSSDWICYAMM